MPTATAPYRIIVGIDFSPTSDLALQEAIDLARRSERPELHLVSVIAHDTGELVPVTLQHESLVETADRVRIRLTAEGTRTLAAYRSRHVGSPTIPAIIHVRVGAIAEQIVNLATEIGGDLVVVGTHGRRGVQRFLLGSVAERTVRLAPCPVFVVRPKELHGMDGVPKLDPACPACLKAREKSGGMHWWCDTHEQAPEPAHTYSRSGRLDDPAVPAPYQGAH